MTTAEIVILVVAGLLVLALVGFVLGMPWHFHPNEVLHDECAKCAYLRWRRR